MSQYEEEKQFIQRLKRRDEAAFAELISSYQNRVFGVVFRMLGDRGEAEDLAQEVFISVFKHIDSFRGDSKLSTWIYRIATNHSKNRIKYLARRFHQKKKTLGRQEDGSYVQAIAPNKSQPDKIFDGNELERVIKVALTKLNPEHREVIILRDIENLSYDEIAKVSGVAEGTVKSRLFRARAALKRQIKEEYH